jgi:4'-phosphopantetheinyl transferase EntD
MSRYQTWKDTWETLLPPAIEIVLGPISQTPPALTKREGESAGNVTSERMLELRTGRDFAKRALASFGIQDVELPVGLDRSPVWPEGVTGSITHVRSRRVGHCAVAVGLTAQFSSIGIDMEYEQDLPVEVWSTFLTLKELDQIRRLGERDQQEDVLCRWCVKESVVKAMDTRLDPLSIETEKTGICGEWRAVSEETNGAFNRLEWSAKSAKAEGLVMAAVAVRQLNP